jgi:hypothetical protein
MKRQLQIGDMVTPLVPPTKNYCLANHLREMGIYYRIDKISLSGENVLLEGEEGGWLKITDVALESEIPKKEENYNYLIPILKKYKIK